MRYSADSAGSCSAASSSPRPPLPATWYRRGVQGETAGQADRGSTGRCQRHMQKEDASCCKGPGRLLVALGEMERKGGERDVGAREEKGGGGTAGSLSAGVSGGWYRMYAWKADPAIQGYACLHQPAPIAHRHMCRAGGQVQRGKSSSRTCLPALHLHICVCRVT